MNPSKINTKTIFTLLLVSPLALAEQDQIQDMSDPLAVYTQAGVGVTNKGLNLKLGQSYDTGSDTTMAMNVLELKGLGGEAIGWADDGYTNDSFDSLRYRNFNVDLTNGRGSQIDLNWDFNNDSGSASYSFIQALPKVGPVQLYPLVGAGLLANETDSGYDLPGSFAVVGMYSKLDITDNVWFNYNPMYLKGLGGTDEVNDASILTHELAVNYQMNPRQNLRLFANFTNKDDVEDWSTFNDYGDIRLEFNHQF